MLAVVLLPIAIMVAAMLLERFEARVVAVRRPERTSRAGLRTSSTAIPTPLLSLVPDPAVDPAGGGRSLPLDAPTLDLPRAS